MDRQPGGLAAQLSDGFKVQAAIFRMSSRYQCRLRAILRCEKFVNFDSVEWQGAS